MTKSKIARFFKVLMLGGLFFASASAISACGGGSSLHDYVHDGSVKLKLDYKGKNFRKDGIGQVKIEQYIDGDTTHFTCVADPTSELIKTRYYGVDTPESTGSIQPWGKAASKFTKSKLEKAAESGTIVISSTFSTGDDGGAGVYGVPETDSTGSRYLTIIWINETTKNAPVESLVCLNLWIVQEGYSGAKATGKLPAFEDTFFEASNQAEANKLHIWSDDPDPDFNYGGYETTSLYDIKQEIEEQFKDPTHKNKFNNANVRFTGVVSGYISNTLYVQERYFFDKDGNPLDPEEAKAAIAEGEEVREEWAGINIFCGMNPINTEYTKINAYLEICGTAVDSENFGFQVSSCSFPNNIAKPSDTDCRILLKAEENTGDHEIKEFTYTMAELSANIAAGNYENLFCRTIITDELRCRYAYVGKTGKDLTMYFDDSEFTAYVPFNYHGNPNDPGDSWLDAEKVIGKTFTLSGVLGHHKISSGSSAGQTKFQIIPTSDNDLVCLTPTKGTVYAEPLTIDEAYEYAVEPLNIPEVAYYAKGSMIGTYTRSSVKDTYNNITLYQVSFTITNGEKTIIVDKANIPGSINSAANEADTEDERNEILNAHYALYLEQSLILVRGHPSLKDGQLTYTGGDVQYVKVHGTDIEDPVSVSEALTIAEALQPGASHRTSSSYFIKGIVKEITFPYGPYGGTTVSRISFVMKDMEDADKTIVIEGAIVPSGEGGINPDDITVGTVVLATGKLMKTDAGVASTYYNGCKVLALYK